MTTSTASGDSATGRGVKALCCVACGKATITCRECGRRTCKHYTRSITDRDGAQYDAMRDAPTELVGTCTPCVLAGTRRRASGR